MKALFWVQLSIDRPEGVLNQLFDLLPQIAIEIDVRC